MCWAYEALVHRCRRVYISLLVVNDRSKIVPLQEFLKTYKRELA